MRCETSSILRFGIEMACREGISDPSSASLAVTKTKDISCDGALYKKTYFKNGSWGRGDAVRVYFT